jgi:hypothetical protein
MNLFSKIRESVKTITNKIVDTVLTKVNRRLVAKKPPIEQIAKELLEKYILEQPEVQAAISEDLRYELGLVDPMERFLNIIDALTVDIQADLTPIVMSGDTLKGGMIINLIDVDYSRALGLGDAIVTTEKGQKLPWLYWMLFEGAGQVVDGYSVEFGPFGRTGGAHMVEGIDGSWGVPAEFAGTANDNFITRAVEQMQPELIQRVNACLA